MKLNYFDDLHNHLTDHKPSFVDNLNDYLWLCKTKDENHRIIDLLKPYIIVVGKIGIGKTIYIKNMAKLTKGITYIEVQYLPSIPMLYRVNAHKIIEIREVDPK